MEHSAKGGTVVFTGGGTGGHIYPALAVAQALRYDFAPEANLLFVGSSRRNEREMVEREGISFLNIEAGAIRGQNPAQAALGLVRLALGVRQARAHLKRHAADVVFATGGYASVPVGLAARTLGIPLIVFLPDVYPGWAVRLLSRLAAITAASTGESLTRLPKGRTVVTGYPVRRAFFATSRESARAKLGLSDGLPAVLIFGGSLGAQRINRAIYAGLESLLSVAEVIHVTGLADHAESLEYAERLPASLRRRYHDFAFLHDMPAAMLAADLAVTRAGASVLGELPAARLPAIVVPLEMSDQTLNARYLEQSGAAMIITHDQLARLPEEVQSLLKHPQRLCEMRAAMAAIAKPEAAKTLARLVLEQMGEN